MTTALPHALAVVLVLAISGIALGADDLIKPSEPTPAKPAPPSPMKWKKTVLSTVFFSEGAHAGDFNKDGKMDIVSGPYWYPGPDFSEQNRREYYPVKPFDPKGYSDNFFAFAHDINGDGWDDILILGFPGKEGRWYENPKIAEAPSADAKPQHWKMHKALEPLDNESPTFADLTGDGKPEIICSSGGHLGYASPDRADPTKPWAFHKISPKGGWQKFTHGLGYGDVNGDGRMDMMDKDGWWEQPASLEGDPEWKHHPVKLGPGGAQMYAYDVNGDGRNDIITSLQAHGYGLAWFEQKPDGTFQQRLIMGATSEENPQGVKFSQPHAVDLVDVDGDGLKDIISGKRWWAHGPKGDAEPNAPAVVYWFKLVREGEGKASFVAHQIDDDSGIGTQVYVTDVNGDKKPDVVVGNKKGTFVTVQQ